MKKKTLKQQILLARASTEGEIDNNIQVTWYQS